MLPINSQAMGIGNHFRNYNFQIIIQLKNLWTNFNVESKWFTCRFGRGIIIYWFGYLDKVATCPENEDIIIVMDEFPKKQDLITMDLPFK